MLVPERGGHGGMPSGGLAGGEDDGGFGVSNHQLHGENRSGEVSDGLADKYLSAQG